MFISLAQVYIILKMSLIYIEYQHVIGSNNDCLDQIVRLYLYDFNLSTACIYCIA